YARMFRHEFDRVIEVSGFEDEDAAEHFASFSIRAVGNHDFSAAQPQGLGRAGGLQAFTAGEMTGGAKVVVIGEAVVDQFRHVDERIVLELFSLDVSKANEFHKRPFA